MPSADRFWTAGCMIRPHTVSVRTCVCVCAHVVLSICCRAVRVCHCRSQHQASVAALAQWRFSAILTHVCHMAWLWWGSIGTHLGATRTMVAGQVSAHHALFFSWKQTICTHSAACSIAIAAYCHTTVSMVTYIAHSALIFQADPRLV